MAHRYPAPNEIAKRIAELNKLIKSASKEDRSRLVRERIELANARARMQPARYFQKPKKRSGTQYDQGVFAPFEGGAPGLGKKS
jgi:hypothetical protein